jgi:hypothetical protein
VLHEEIPSSWRGGGLLLPPHAYEKVKKGTEGAQPAMFAAGAQTGRLIWVKPAYPIHSRPQPDGPSSEPPAPGVATDPVDLLAERRAKHLNRRIARMGELTRELLERCDSSAFSFPILVALARVFGTEQSLKGVWHYNSRSDPWADFHAFCGLSNDEAAADIWTCQLQPVLASRLQYCGPKDSERLQREIQAALKLIGASYDELYRTVAQELPEPKAWVKLPGYKPEDLEFREDQAAA